MSFCTPHNDGASGLAEPVNTVPANDQAGMHKIARHYGAEHLAELYSSPSLKQDGYDPKKAGSN